MWFRAREAILKPEYREWYPWVIPGVGYRASWLATIVRRQRRDAEPHWEPEPRIPNDQHFAFRGGWRWPRMHRRTRRVDHGLAPI
jgi:hypothetical protein